MPHLPHLEILINGGQSIINKMRASDATQNALTYTHMAKLTPLTLCAIYITLILRGKFACAPQAYFMESKSITASFWYAVVPLRYNLPNAQLHVWFKLNVGGKSSYCGWATAEYAVADNITTIKQNITRISRYFIGQTLLHNNQLAIHMT